METRTYILTMRVGTQILVTKPLREHRQRNHPLLITTPTSIFSMPYSSMSHMKRCIPSFLVTFPDYCYVRNVRKAKKEIFCLHEKSVCQSYLTNRRKQEPPLLESSKVFSRREQKGDGYVFKTTFGD